MKLRRIYNVVIDDIVFATSTNYQQILKIFEAIKRAEPKAHIEVYYA